MGRYSGLRGGTYTLRINGTNNDGVWNTPEQAVRLTVNVAASGRKGGYDMLNTEYRDVRAERA